ncbi:MAG: UbiA family prenyltransferase [Methanomassiliicoccales archaeon]|nr:MAG: UbiA family prenyltransferase [Methanomassiliicoccales archaeon]
MGKLHAWFRIIRPPILLISALGAAVGALNVNLDPDPLTFWLALIAWAPLVYTGIMIHNDYTDLASDKINRPHKPIPSGAISAKSAKWSGLGMMASGTVLAFFIDIHNGNINLSAGFVALSLTIVGIVYNHWGKGWGIWGNVFVAYGVAIIPFYGAVAMEPVDGIIAMAPLTISIFVMEIGREIIVCAEDVEGDIRAGFKTFPVRIGAKKSMVVAVFFYIGYAILYPAPYLFRWDILPSLYYDPVYLFGATVFAIVLFATWAITYKEMTEKAFWNYIRTGTRVGVIFFQFILLISAYYPGTI